MIVASRKNTLMILSFVISLVVVIYRRPDAFYNSQFWGEEGTVFFLEAYTNSFHSMFNTCAGYYHLYPRLIACICNSFHVTLNYIPFIYCYAWLLILLAVIWYVWKRLSFDEFQKFFISIAVVLIPLQSEVYMNQTNVQWIMALFPIIIFSSTDLKTNKQWFYIDVIILLLSGFTGPNFTVLLPLFLYLLIHQKKYLILDKQRIILYAIAIICGVIGAVALYKHGSVNRADGDFTLFNKGFIQFIFVQYAFLFIGKFAFKLPYIIMLLSVVTFFVSLFWRVKKRLFFKENDFAMISLIAGLLFLASTLVAYRNEPSLLSPYYRGVRNFYIPALTFVWVVMDLMSFAKYRISMLSSLMLLFSLELVLFVGQFKFDDFHIKQYSEKIRTADTLSIPINPAGWHIYIDNRKFKVQ